jgi:hypothetical protein
MIGLLSKETVVISLLPLFFYNLMQSNLKKTLSLFIILLTLFVLEQHTVRMFNSIKTGFYWMPNFNILWSNLMRPRTIISLILTLGLPGLFSLIFLFKKWKFIIKNKILLALYSGFLGSMGFYLANRKP